MNKIFKSTHLLLLALLFTAFACNNDDNNEVVVPNIEINLTDLTVAIDENPTDGQVVATVQTDSNEASNFSITSQTPSGALSIDSNTGEVTVANATLFDFETNPAITATVTVDDAVNPATVTVNLNNLDEISAQDLTVAIDENPTDGQVVGAIQVDGSGTLSFSIASQTPAGALNIDAGTGELTVVDPNLFDFETNPVITATIQVDDAADTTMATATINLNDVDEIIFQDLTADIDENPTNGQVIGAIQATSANTLTYAITYQSNAGALSIDPNTGELSVADYTLFDFETTPSMFATISVDNGVYSVSATATINIIDIAEPATVGEFRDGGVVFWVDPADNTHGLVLTVNNHGNGVEWGCEGLAIPGASGSAIGTGAANTAAIEAACTTSGTAADIAANLSLNGYDDWFLPSWDEWSAVYNNIGIINATAVANGGVNILSSTSDRYWTSTEDGANAARGFRGSDGTSNTVLRIAGMKVRAARAF
jgi:uncharacterized protein YggU (UPF0235/DUF167 family)